MDPDIVLALHPRKFLKMLMQPVMTGKNALTCSDGGSTETVPPRGKAVALTIDNYTRPAYASAGELTSTGLSDGQPSWLRLLASARCTAKLREPEIRICQGK